MKWRVSFLGGFTLIELIIAMSIFFLLSSASYIPYSHSRKVGLVNQWIKEITQSLYETRNLSINGLDSGSGNLSIGLYFDASEGENRHITYFSYPYSFSGSQITVTKSTDIHIEKIKELPLWVQIENIGGKERFLIFFHSISGKGEYFFWDDTSPIKQNFLNTEIEVGVSYKGSTSPSLNKSILYYTQGNIADY